LLHLIERLLEVGGRLADRRADTRDDLDRRLEQLVLGLGVLAVGEPDAHLVEDARRRRRQLPRLKVDELQLPLHAEARALGGAERDFHDVKIVWPDPPDLYRQTQ